MFIESIEDAVGRTPLCKIGHLCENGSTVLAKLEFLNPASSVKDRVALFMIERAMEAGKINKDSVIIEPTSGNTGIGLAMVCASKSLRLILSMPESMSLERRAILTHLGAELELTPASLGMQGAIDRANELLKSTPNSFMPNQFKNSDNPLAHARSTALEILEDSDSKIDFFVASIGTGGTISGVGKVLKEQLEKVKIIGVEPENSPIITEDRKGSHKIEGIGAGFIPDILDLELIDDILTVSDEEAIFYAREASRRAGILCGISSGANLAIAHKIAKHISYSRVVTVLPDTAQRYLSTELFQK